MNKDEIEDDLKALSYLAKIAGKPDLAKELKPFKKNNPFIEFYKRQQKHKIETMENQERIENN